MLINYYTRLKCKSYFITLVNSYKEFVSFLYLILLFISINVCDYEEIENTFSINLFML